MFIELDDIEVDYSLTLLSTSRLEGKTLNQSEYLDFLDDMISCYMALEVTSYRCIKSEPDIQIKNYSGMKLGGYIAHYYTNQSKNGTIYLENFKYSQKEDIEF